MHIDDAALRADLAATGRTLVAVHEMAATAAKNGSADAELSASISNLCRSAIEDEAVAREVALILDAEAYHTFESESFERRTATEAGAAIST